MQRAFEPATGEIESLIKQALEDRLAANDLPDGNLLSGSRRIAVRDEMPEASLTFSAAALPRRDGYAFYLISTATAQTDADQNGQEMPFITIDRPSIGQDTAMIWLGVDVAAPRNPNLVRLCCCSGEAQFRRVEHRWRFVKWDVVMCSLSPVP